MSVVMVNIGILAAKVVPPCQLLDAVDQIKLAKEEAQEEAGRLAWCNWLNIDYHWLVIFGTTKMGGTGGSLFESSKGWGASNLGTSMWSSTVRREMVYFKGEMAVQPYNQQLWKCHESGISHQAEFFNSLLEIFIWVDIVRMGTCSQQINGHELVLQTSSMGRLVPRKKSMGKKPWQPWFPVFRFSEARQAKERRAQEEEAMKVPAWHKGILQDGRIHEMAINF